MKQVEKNIVSKIGYESPQINIVQFSCDDIITTSGDKNQGEWDSQSKGKTW